MPIMETRNDAQLVADYLKGDEESLRVLIEKYLDPIYRFTRIYLKSEQEAEDITQEVFVRAWRNLKKFDQEKSFKTWIFAIAKHASIDALKKKRALNFSAFEDENGDNALHETLMDSALLPDEIAEKKSTARMLGAATALLSPAYQRVLALRYEDDLTFAKISETLHEPLYTVKSRHWRAIVLLKKIVGDADRFF